MSSGVATGDNGGGGETEVSGAIAVTAGTSDVLLIVGSATLTTGSVTPVVPFGIACDVGGKTFTIKFENFDNTEWTVSIQDDFDTVSDIVLLSSATAYPLTFIIADGAQQISVNGTTLTSDFVFSAPSTELTRAIVELGVGSTLSGFTLTDEAAAGDADIAITAPSPTIVARIGGSASIVATSQPPQLSVFGGANIALAAPSPVFAAVVRDSTGKNACTFTAPSPTLVVWGGANIELEAPAPVLAVTATGTNWGQADLIGTVPTVSASVTVSATADILVAAPSPNLIGYGGAVISITIDGGSTVVSTGITGGVGAVEITAPLFELVAAGTAQSYGSAHLLAPSPRMGATAQAYLIAPGATLVAIGSATVALTYEAYALNLNHKPRGQETNDELTRFTNYPFDKIVRYQNSYFGVNSTGLYLLEGTTDYASPTATAVPYSVKTKLTDFGTEQMKTPESAVFGGRLGPEATVTVYTGETEDDVYAYTTPRGTDVQNYRQKFGKGLKARYYAFGIAGSGALTLDTVSFDIAKLKRRI